MDSLGNDHAPRSARSASDPSRRAVLRAAGALGIAGTALLAAPAAAAAAFRGAPAATVDPSSAGLPVAGGPPFAGVDRSALATMLSANTPTPSLTSLPTAVRWYEDAAIGSYPNTKGYAGWTWPNPLAEYNSHARVLVSIRPDLQMLVDGQFDADLYAFMSSAPGSFLQGSLPSLLTMWHESATFSTQKGTNYPADAGLFREGLSHLQALAWGNIPGHSGETNVKVGVIDVNPAGLRPFYPAGTNPQDIYNMWMAPGLDWYGCDLYDNTSHDLSAYNELNHFSGCMNTLCGTGENVQSICIPECNSGPYTVNGVTYSTKPVPDGPTGFRRSDFFHYAWAWLNNIGGGGALSGLLGFWNGPGNEGSPWPPPNTTPPNTPSGSLDAMIAELNAEFAQAM